MIYDILMLLRKHRACLKEIAKHFERYFTNIDYSKKQKNIKKQSVRSLADLDKILGGPGFYLIATDLPTKRNQCTAVVQGSLKVVYRGHSYHVRERIESHLFYKSYRAKDSGRRFTVCMKIDGRNININRHPLNKRQWFVVTHSMRKSTRLIREAAEEAFDAVFGKPVGSDR